MTKETAHSPRAVLAAAESGTIFKRARMLGVAAFAIATSTTSATAPIDNLAFLAFFGALPVSFPVTISLMDQSRRG